MIWGDLEVIGHIPPRPRIEIGVNERGRLGIQPPPSSAEICARLMRLSEGERVWKLIVEVSR